MKTIIENKIKIRQGFCDSHYNSWDEEKNEYTIEEPKEIDVLGKEIEDLLKENHQNLPVDFVVESLTHLGYATCILYDDNGNFAITSDGLSSISEEPNDCSLSFFVEKKYWKPTIREAMEVYFNEYWKAELYWTTS